MSYTIHTEATAPEAARSTLQNVKKGMGQIPNLFGIMADAPTLLKGYLALADLFDQTSLTPTERQVVLISSSLVNECAYCMAAQTVISGMQKIPEAVVQALRNNTPIADSKLEALRLFAADVTASQGHPSEQNLTRFFNAGYTHTHVLEVILGVGMKVLSNYTNHVAQTPLDAAFASAAWQKKG